MWILKLRWQFFIFIFQYSHLNMTCHIQSIPHIISSICTVCVLISVLFIFYSKLSQHNASLYLYTNFLMLHLKYSSHPRINNSLMLLALLLPSLPIRSTLLVSPSPFRVHLTCPFWWGLPSPIINQSSALKQEKY